MGTETGDDAAVYRINDDTALIMTRLVDFFPPITDDPFEFGAIAAANALSDVYAMGGKPLVALNICGFPASLDKGILGEILRGGYSKTAEAQCLIVGGHTVDDPEPKYGLSVVGIVEPGKQTTNAGARVGDSLILSKPLGTGIITTAGKQGRVEPDVLQGAVNNMAALNRERLRGHDQGRRSRLHRHYRLRADGTPEVHGQGQPRYALRLTSARCPPCPEPGSCWNRESPPAAPVATATAWPMSFAGTRTCRITTSYCCATPRLPAACSMAVSADKEEPTAGGIDRGGNALRQAWSGRITDGPAGTIIANP